MSELAFVSPTHSPSNPALYTWTWGPEYLAIKYTLLNVLYRYRQVDYCLETITCEAADGFLFVVLMHSFKAGLQRDVKGDIKYILVIKLKPPLVAYCHELS